MFDNNFKVYSVPHDPYRIKFINFTHPISSFYNCHIYKKHKYNFEIKWQNIDDADTELVNQIRTNNDINSPFKSIETLFDTHFINNHLFMVPTMHKTFIEYNNKTRRIQRHITQDEVFHLNCRSDEFDIPLLYDNISILKKFEHNAKPVYTYCLPEDISYFKFVWGNYALSDQYIYYICV